jgi:hypothetical protein
MESPVEIELETRRRIYDFVVANPGTHLRGIKDELDMPMGQLEYHLHYLETRSILDSKEDRYYKRFFPHEMSATDRRILAAIRQGPGPGGEIADHLPAQLPRQDGGQVLRDLARGPGVTVSPSRRVAKLFEGSIACRWS